MSERCARCTNPAVRMLAGEGRCWEHIPGGTNKLATAVLPPQFTISAAPEAVGLMRMWADFFDSVASCPKEMAVKVELGGMKVEPMRENIRRYAHRLQRTARIRVIHGEMYVFPRPTKVSRWAREDKKPPQVAYEPRPSELRA